jgi:fermentation-respiration switch protein FrsA (DUF1100 family)
MHSSALLKLARNAGEIISDTCSPRAMRGRNRGELLYSGREAEMRGTESTKAARSRVIIWLPFLLSLGLAIALIINAVAGCGGAGGGGSQGAPDYADPDSFSEQEVTVGSGEWSLPGTLTMPKGEGPFPALVLVHGSGPNNRDEGGDLIAPFKDLAWGLASQGVAVLRYDKRTLVYQDELAAQGGDITVWEETVDDAAAAVDLLLGTEGIDTGNVFVLGHSLGGMLIPRIAGVSPQARGFVILAGPARPFEDLIMEQTAYIASLDGVVTPDEQASLDHLRIAVARVKSPELSPSTPASELPFGASASYWLDLRGYDPAESARSIDRPILVLQGERDYQVTMEDFQRWKDALSGMPNVTFKTYPDLNHLFITGTGKSVPSEYNLPGHVSQAAVDDIASFIKGNLAGR